MIVEKLIEELKKYDGELEVTVCEKESFHAATEENPADLKNTKDIKLGAYYSLSEEVVTILI